MCVWVCVCVCVVYVCNTCYLLASATPITLHTPIILNTHPTDAHNPNVKAKMTKDAFVRMNAGICQGHDLPRDYLASL